MEYTLVLKYPMFFAVGFVAACAATAVFAHTHGRLMMTMPNQIAEQCAIVAHYATNNIASTRMLQAASLRITEPCMRACTTAGRVVVSMTSMPLRAKMVPRRLTAASGMFA